MIRLLIAEDSPVMAQILTRLFEGDPEFEVVGVASNGDEVVSMAATLKPDVITMDMMMPKRDGVAATEAIMEETPTPIVVVSSHVNDREMRVTFRSLAAGALSVLEKPENIFAPEFEARRKSFVDTVRAMATVKVVRRRRARTLEADAKAIAASIPRKASFKLCVIGASTGGPQGLDRILRVLPSDFPLPIVIAQHISRGFSKGMADWLNGRCKLTVKLATDGEPCEPGVVYIAPDGTHIGVRAGQEFPRISIGPEQPETVLTPSVDHLFQTAADVMGEHVVSSLLTGMGRDGSLGLQAIRKKGGHTIAESEESCVVFGMPAAAIEIGAAIEVLSTDMIAAYLKALADTGK